MRIIIHLTLLCMTIGNFVFGQLARTSYVDRNINNLRTDLESQINALERKLGVTSSKIESNASHISKIYPNGIPREVYLYNRGNLEKHKPYKITAKIQYTNDGSIKIINRFHDNGKIMFTGGFIAERQNGKWKEWYENEQKKNEKSYKNGKPDGLWKEWYENGQQITIGTFKDSLRIGKWIEWYENGQMKREETFKDGKEDGLSTEWYENGQKSSEGTYKDGRINGLKTYWDENGQKSRELTYNDGKLDGLLTIWDENGNEQSVSINDGKFIGEINAFKSVFIIDGRFRCFDGSKSVQASWVNDNECDCSDCSDEPLMKR